jgi:hypothetical protein
MMEFPEPVDEQAYTQAMQTETDELLEAYHAHTGEWVMFPTRLAWGWCRPTKWGAITATRWGAPINSSRRRPDRVIFMVAGILWLLNKYLLYDQVVCCPIHLPKKLF